MPSYCTAQQIYDYYGQVNVRKWADYDNTGSATTIDQNIANAIDWATGEVDDKLRGGVVSIPFADIADPTPTPSLIMDLARKLAGVQLYSSRGAEDFDDKSRAKDRLESVRKEVYQKLAEIKSGIVRMDATHYDVDMGPFAMSSRLRTCTPDGFTICRESV